MLTDRDPLLTTRLCPYDDLLTQQAKRPRRRILLQNAVRDGL